ncbi:MAG: amylo-alpha-1,6-glucosidase [Alkalispirochaeta sp.]
MHPELLFSIFNYEPHHEWLVTNGIGGYAAGTVSHGRSRVYHGLLVAAESPPVGRSLLVPLVNEVITYRGVSIDLTTVEWADGTMAPDGRHYLSEFFLESGLPVWRYRFSDAVLERRLWMPDRRNEIRMRYVLRAAAEPAELSVTVFASHRDHHAISGGRPGLSSSVAEGSLRIADASTGAIQMAARWIPTEESGDIESAGWTVDDEVYYQNRLRMESYRGLPDLEDLWAAGSSVVTIHADRSVDLSVVAEDHAHTGDADRDELAAEHHRRRQVLNQFRSAIPASTSVTPEVEQLVFAADQFIVDRNLPEGETGKTIIAGYPWFGDWGRDTMISLPGLTLATGRFDEARWILRTFARFIDAGMLPNLFPDGTSEPEYNTVDATLWYFEAIRAYLQATGDTSLPLELLPALRSIIDHHREGTRYGIGVDESDGLLRAGAPGVQLTWMDAQIGDWVVTPRRGKPVEINALWHHALVVMAALERLPGGDPTRAETFERAARSTEVSFRKFVGPRGLLDVIEGPDGDDPAIRPNQIFALSLTALRADDPRVADAPLLSAEDQVAVLEVVSRELLTSEGLRSLSPSDPAYQGWYGGSPQERDAVYHQGPVWGWLIGPYVDAHLMVYRRPEQLLHLLDSTMRSVLRHGCVGTVAEIYHGDAPHQERGAFAQAWSVAELLRAWRQIVTAIKLREK